MKTDAADIAEAPMGFQVFQNFLQGMQRNFFSGSGVKFPAQEEQLKRMQAQQGQQPQQAQNAKKAQANQMQNKQNINPQNLQKG